MRNLEIKGKFIVLNDDFDAIEFDEFFLASFDEETGLFHVHHSFEGDDSSWLSVVVPFYGKCEVRELG